MCSVVGSVVFAVSQPGCLQLVVAVSGCQLSALAVDVQAVVSIQLLLASPVSAAAPALCVAVSVVEVALPRVCIFLGDFASCVEVVMTVLQNCYISPATLSQFQMFFSESSFSECSSEVG